tara:strand:- start:207 stop:635 length:429 start_codon:yes stop_codon:yes gene_type:complete
MKLHDEIVNDNEKHIEKLLKTKNTCPITLGEEGIERVVHNIFVFYEKKAYWQKTLLRLEKTQKNKEYEEFNKLGKEHGTIKDREITAKLSDNVKKYDNEITHAVYMLECYKGLIAQTEMACNLYRTQQASNRSQLASYTSLG